MGQIKSAWELAMERSEGLSFDKEEYKRKESFQKGRAFGLKALENGVDWAEDEFKNLVSDGGMDKSMFLSGFTDALLAAFQLQSYGQTFTAPPAQELFHRIVKKKAGEAFYQLGQLVLRFNEEQERLKESILQQIGPRLKQRAEQVARQAGVSVQYALERDPEFVKVFNQNLEMIRTQYQNYMERLKNEVRRLVR